jgi:DNA repair exonuclease SbcCD ATPase subunit
MLIIKDKCEYYKRVISLCLNSLEFENKINKLKAITIIDTNKLKEKKYYLDELNNKIILAEQKINHARDIWKYKSNIEKDIKNLNEELKKAEKEFESLKDELGICPLCGNKLNGDKDETFKR